MLLNAIALTPLLERFEAEHGTLTALLLFVGRMSLAFYNRGGIQDANQCSSTFNVPRRDIHTHREIYTL